MPTRQTHHSASRARALSVVRPTDEEAHEAARPRLLIVDEDGAARTVLVSRLRAEGFSISTAADGASALVEARRDRPDVVITDLTMPRMDGVELCRCLHALYPDLPVIVVTAHSDTSSAIESLRAGVEDYLTKPIELEGLLHRLERTLERSNSKIELARLTEETRIINERLILSSVREQENAEAAERQRAQLSALLENLSDGVVTADRSGRILIANRVARELWLGEQTISDVHQLDALETRRLDGTPCPVDEHPLTRALRGERFDQYELLCVRPDGELRRLTTSGTNVTGSDGLIELAIVVFRDVTELHRLERQRDEYVALISHDLRGPLSCVLGSASMLVESAKKQESSGYEVRAIERIARNAQRMNTMIAELLDSATFESEGIKLSKEPCDLREMVAGIVHDLDEARMCRITLETNDTNALVLAEPPKIERAISNIIVNALKYSSEDAPVRVVLTRMDENVVLEVVDRGIGIAPAHVPRLFERYYRVPTGKRSPGLGLGLYITRLIVEAHDGRIDVESEEGRGSTFRMLLPSHVAQE